MGDRANEVAAAVAPRRPAGHPGDRGASVELIGGVVTTFEALLRPIVAVHTLGRLGRAAAMALGERRGLRSPT